MRTTAMKTLNMCGWGLQQNQVNSANGHFEPVQFFIEPLTKDRSDRSLFIFSSLVPVGCCANLCHQKLDSFNVSLRLARTLRSAEALSSDGQLDRLVCVDLWKLFVWHVSMMISRISMLISM